MMKKPKRKTFEKGAAGSILFIDAMVEYFNQKKTGYDTIISTLNTKKDRILKRNDPQKEEEKRKKLEERLAKLKQTEQAILDRLNKEKANEPKPPMV